jgi:PAS domain S-box-containing protein
VRHAVINGKGYVIASLRDITERKKMENELHRLSMVAKRTSNAVIITDEHRNITWVNEAFTNITGYTLAEVIGKSPKIFQFEETDENVIQQANQKLHELEPVRFEVLNKGKLDKIYWLDIEIQPLFDNQAKHKGFMAIQTDITARKKHEQMIQKQNEALREIAFFQSHVLRRPVANVLGLCNLIEIAREENADLSVIYEYLKYLLVSVQETDKVIHQIVTKANEITDEEDEDS